MLGFDSWRIGGAGAFIPGTDADVSRTLPSTAPTGAPDGSVSPATGGAFGTGEGEAGGAAASGPGDSRSITEPALGVAAGPVPERFASHFGGCDGVPPRRIEASSWSSAGPSRSTLP